MPLFGWILRKQNIKGCMSASFHHLIIEPVSLPARQSLREVFASVMKQHMAVLFDSAGHSADSRFSIMAWSPVSTIITRDGTTTVTECADDTRHTTTEEPFLVLNRVHARFTRSFTIADGYEEIARDLPFMVGLAGLAGYDTGRYYEQLPSQARQDYDCPDIAVGLYAQSLIEDKQSGQLYHCRLDSLPPLDIHQWRADHVEPFELKTDWQSNLTKDEYVNALTRIAAYLRAGDCYQVNMAQRFSARYRGHPFDAYCRLRDSNKAPFSAYMQCHDSHVLSISPERFLSVDKHGSVQTKPIKGTRPRFDDPQADAKSADALLSADKDRAENLMIVDLLRNDISKHCAPHSVEVPSLFALESFPAVHHLVSTVTGKLRNNHSPLDLLAGAFPGGSITGAPKIRAMEIIDELEPHRRNVYCGSMFYYGAMGDLDSSICIRTLLAEHNRIHCWAGGGIVLDSDPYCEYQETLDKVAKILPELAVNREQK